MTGIYGLRWQAVSLLAASLALTACDSAPNFGAVGNFFGQNRDAADSSLPRPEPDSRGVITYATYQVMVARQGDTIPSMATRVGLSPEEIATHNGLPVTYTPRDGEVLALPRNVGGTPATVEGWSPDVALSALDDSNPTTTTLPPAGGGTAGAENPFNNGQTGSVIDPIRHRVQAGETAFSIARLYNVSVTALAS
ncbi:MAG: LysM domain-containing protein [Pseudomonadota bacterium]